MKQKNKDMYLPSWVCALGAVLLIASCVCLILCFLISLYLQIGFVVCFALGGAAILCWKNQGVNMIDDETFIYTTMFKREVQCRFSDIRELKENADSATLVLENNKVHIESCAILSDRFITAVKSALTSKCQEH